MIFLDSRLLKTNQGDVNVRKKTTGCHLGATCWRQLCRVLLDLFNTTLPRKAWLWAFNSLSSPVAESALKLLVPTE